MKKRMAITVLIVLALLGGACVVATSGGSASDPMISKHHVDEVYGGQMLKLADEKIAQRYDAIYQSAEGKLKARYEALVTVFGAPKEGHYYASSFSDVRLKRGDSILVRTGSGIQLLAGTATMTATGAVVDVTSGGVAANGAFTIGRRYLAAEATTATVTVTSPTAVLSIEGVYESTPSRELDFNALAGALKTLGLFQGSDTGYGAGYDLEQPPTRLQGLILFLRLLGEEDDALATVASNPFQDVPNWAAAYVAYAYEQGYTKGVDETQFDSNRSMSAADYITFILRALGYQENGPTPHFTWNTALQNALDLKVVTAREYKMLIEESFLRAHVVYLSYFALDAVYQDGSQTLQTALVATGVFDQAIVDLVRNSTAVQRMI